MPKETKTALFTALKTTDREIFELQQKRDELAIELEEYSREADEVFLIRHWKKLIELQQKFAPQMFQGIIISCFPLCTSVCCCQSASRKFIYASHLFDLWGNGFVYDGKPVVDVRVYNGREPRLFFIDGDVISSVNVALSDIQRYKTMIDDVPLPKTRYSLTSISDIKMKSLI